MTFQELISLTKVYTRDTNSRIFSDGEIKVFINQGIDRMRQYNVFQTMGYLSTLSCVPSLLPPMYHYLLALFSASRLFDTDERFYEGTEKRNEFEQVFADLIDKIECGSVVITDELGEVVTNTSYVSDFINDVYFNTASTDEDVVII